MRKLTTEEFVAKATVKHGNRYDYSLTKYVDAKTNVKILCPIHSEFSKNPSHHLANQGCPKCGIASIGDYKRKSHEQFVSELKLINPNIIVVGKYIGTHCKILIKDIYDIEYLVDPNSLLQNFHPIIKSAIDKNLAFKIKSNIIHNFKYNYDKSIYMNCKNKIIITCPIHGDFEQQANHHLEGHGCHKCSEYGFQRTQWINHCKSSKNAIPNIYIIRCYNENEEFIKIGMTSLKISKRFPSNSKMPYSYEIIKEIKGSPDFIWDREKELHKLCNHLKYKPLLYFVGKTECFKIESLELL